MIASLTRAQPGVRPSTVGQLVLLALGFAWALGAEVVRLSVGWPLEWVLADLLPGLAFQVVGVVAWRRRPGNRVGPLMFAVGVTWFFGTWAASGNPVVDLVGGAFQGYYDGLLAWLVLAYPSGRLTDRAARAVVAAFLGTLVARTIFRFAAYRGFNSYDFAIPSEADRYIADTNLREAGEQVFVYVIAAISIVVLVLILARLRTATSAGRRVAAPILIGGIAVAAGILAEFATGFVRPVTLDDRKLLSDIGLYITALTGALVPLGFLYGMARTRLARASVADLVVELGDSERIPSLRDVIARALRDPTLSIAYAVPSTTDFIDAEGRPVELPDPARTDRAVTRLEHRGKTIAALVHDPALAEEEALVTSVAAAARMALDNERLQAEVRAQLDEVRASRTRIVAAGDAERRRIERDLHDGAQQRLVTLALALQMARRQVGDNDRELAAMLDRAGGELDSALSELRELARGVHPSLLVEAGLAAALEALADRAPLPVTVSANLTGPCARPDLEATAYFVVSEALANVAKHAGATSVAVDVSDDAGTLRVTVQDDGAGGADPARGSGLRGLSDRVAAVGGTLTVTSPVGGGTSVRAEIPCA